ncbi:MULTISPECIES: PIG-L deacetylase family protein [unclassified Pseudomonas]|uniref:PIG-L deacetylase family protein n=1 Tax=unclassified Pseudomonas TaxID=196821 RepID=UPI000BD6F87D|nr:MULTISPECIES: PIG-L family deacetylase [unclassified Pseudomonas]PVZ15612.1 LmbE family N-acetylglucosaminyl deacetylase [Pseudomonas sp. URIL14HWK12:I12]PVZ24986.1 LmbE family N-acetylglucosaminyl deacetylase [Pseudomonas sp. URIL14HWK12:I10]PVZ34832.1 LmbE family N-acetylglucosaminyl deacetylase [Pseudomonas sp. URIL14HWK12:I11]SNZ09402.1 N-acetylglucosaminyl deacetylase, LmbE family [Pseudomonas sp. URIL14HWK12:I9]
MSRKQALLRRHRRNKRIGLIVGLLLLVVMGVLLAWWVIPLGALLAWMAHEAWFSDHLFYSPAQDYQYALPTQRQWAVSVAGGRLALPADAAIEQGDTLVLQVRLRSTWLGRFLDPWVAAGHDRQTFERGVRGLRYLNLTGANLAEGLALQARHCRLAPEATLLAFSPPAGALGRVLVIAPHADDAELAAFELYSQARESWIVTLTAGEIEAEHYEQMGLAKAQASRLKGQLRAWDSLAVPLWAGVPAERCVQLGYFCLQLPAMREQPDTPIASRAAELADVRPFRRFNQVSLRTDSDGAPTWANLVGDLIELFERVRPDAIVLPDAGLDPHPDHIAARQATAQALEATGQAPLLLGYANHLHDNDRWPMGNGGDGVALPPHFDASQPRRPWVVQVSPEQQWQKAMALGMMHDLQPPLPAKRRMRRWLQRLLAGREWPRYGENEFFRKAVRRHELFWVQGLEPGPAGRGPEV